MAHPAQELTRGMLPPGPCAGLCLLSSAAQFAQWQEAVGVEDQSLH